MKRIPKEIIALIIAAALIIILLIVLSAASGGSKGGGEGSFREEEKPVAEAPVETTTESNIADVDPIELPDKSEAEQLLGFEPKQVERLSDKYVLRLFQIEGSTAVYYYQQHLAANATRLQIKITKMTPEEYAAALPKENVRETADIGGREGIFADRMLLKVGQDIELTEDSMEKRYEKEGIAVIERVDFGRELAPMQTLEWYENNCRYQLHAEYLDLTKEEMTELALYYINNGE